MGADGPAPRLSVALVAAPALASDMPPAVIGRWQPLKREREAGVSLAAGELQMFVGQTVGPDASKLDVRQPARLPAATGPLWRTHAQLFKQSSLQSRPRGSVNSTPASAAGAAAIAATSALPAPALFLPTPGSADFVQQPPPRPPGSRFYAPPGNVSSAPPLLPSFWPGMLQQGGAQSFVGPTQLQLRGSCPTENDASGSEVLRGGSPTPEMLVEHADALLSLALSPPETPQEPEGGDAGAPGSEGEDAGALEASSDEEWQERPRASSTPSRLGPRSAGRRQGGSIGGRRSQVQERGRGQPPGLRNSSSPAPAPEDEEAPASDGSSDSESRATMPAEGSSAIKRRLRWTPELQVRFNKAVKQLGGLDYATPKVIQRHMNVDFLTVYHVKSYLQKQRLSAGIKVTRLNTRPVVTPELPKRQRLEAFIGASLAAWVPRSEGILHEGASLPDGSGAVTGKPPSAHIPIASSYLPAPQQLTTAPPVGHSLAGGLSLELSRQQAGGRPTAQSLTGGPSLTYPVQLTGSLPTSSPLPISTSAAAFPRIYTAPFPQAHLSVEPTRSEAGSRGKGCGNSSGDGCGDGRVSTGGGCKDLSVAPASHGGGEGVAAADLQSSWPKDLARWVARPFQQVAAAVAAQGASAHAVSAQAALVQVAPALAASAAVHPAEIFQNPSQVVDSIVQILQEQQRMRSEVQMLTSDMRSRRAESAMQPPAPFVQLPVPRSLDGVAQEDHVQAHTGGPGTGSGSDTSPRNPRRQYLRWTSQLQERFLEVVAKLGGLEMATPSRIAQLMQVVDLTVDQVKSHLQKQRLDSRRSAAESVKVPGSSGRKTGARQRTAAGAVPRSSRATLPSSLHLFQAAGPAAASSAAARPAPRVADAERPSADTSRDSRLPARRWTSEQRYSNPPIADTAPVPGVMSAPAPESQGGLLQPIAAHLLATMTEFEARALAAGLPTRHDTAPVMRDMDATESQRTIARRTDHDRGRVPFSHPS